MMVNNKRYTVKRRGKNDVIMYDNGHMISEEEVIGTINKLYEENKRLKENNRDLEVISKYERFSLKQNGNALYITENQKQLTNYFDTYEKDDLTIIVNKLNELSNKNDSCDRFIPLFDNTRDGRLNGVKDNGSIISLGDLIDLSNELNNDNNYLIKRLCELLEELRHKDEY